jgi:hypothetical protein
MKAFLLALIPTLAFAGPYDGATDRHFELRAEITEDGFLVKSFRLNQNDYKTSTDCEKDGILVESPPPAAVVDGHNVVFSIACVRVKEETK